MTIQITTNSVSSSGPLSFSELRNQLKEVSSGSIALGEMYRNGSFVPTASMNGNVPTSGTIRASNLRGVASLLTATITNVEQNLNANTNIFNVDYVSPIRKTINVSGVILSQNSNPALLLPSGSGSTIRIQLTAGGIFGHRGIGGSGGPPNSGGGGAGFPGNLALRTFSNIAISGTGAGIRGGGGGGGGGGAGGQEGPGGRNKRGYSCGFFGWQYCEDCDTGVGGGSDSGGAGGAGGQGRGYFWDGVNLVLVGPTGGTAGSNPGNGGGVGGTGGSGGDWGTPGAVGGSGGTGNTGPGGNCGGGGGGSGGGPGGGGGAGGISIEGWNRVVSIQSTAVLSGTVANN